MNINDPHDVWARLLRTDLATLQAMARTGFKDDLSVYDGVTYLSANDAFYGIEGFDDDVRLRDWLYYRMTGTVEGAALQAAFDAQPARRED